MKTPRAWALAFVAAHLLTLSACVAASSDDDSEASSRNAVSQKKPGTTKEDPPLNAVSAEGGVGPEAGIDSSSGGSSTGSSSGSTTTASQTVKVNGVRCTVGKTSLSQGIEGHGWTLVVNANCPIAVVLEVSGVTDVPYPQNATRAFLSQPALVLSLDNGDGTGDTFSSDDYEGMSSITAGPTGNDARAIRGTGRVVVLETGASRSVSFDITL